MPVFLIQTRSFFELSVGLKHFCGKLNTENFELVADGKTKASADRGEAPGYLMSRVDPETGLSELVTDGQGRVLRHFFEPGKAQAAAAARAAEDRRTQNDPWLIINEGTSFGPFYGDYWVLDHADDYSWSIVGDPSGRYLWILSRQPKSAEAAVRYD